MPGETLRLSREEVLRQDLDVLVAESERREARTCLVSPHGA